MKEDGKKLLNSLVLNVCCRRRLSLRLHKQERVSIIVKRHAPCVCALFLLHKTNPVVKRKRIELNRIFFDPVQDFILKIKKVLPPILIS